MVGEVQRNLGRRVEVQERVSREIVRALDITLTSDEHRRLAQRPIADARAFE